ncbi:MAG: hypothetical protein AAF227_10375 [Pseudomonadota bacterium]
MRYVARMSRKQTSAPPKKGETREDRLKAALKANLQRRKKQAEARTGENAGKEAE